MSMSIRERRVAIDETDSDVLWGRESGVEPRQTVWRERGQRRSGNGADREDGRHGGVERTVIVIGESLLLDALEASLAARPELAVLRVHCAVCDTIHCLKSLTPDVVIFDVDTPVAAAMFRVLRERPGLPLVGVDIASSRALVLSSQNFAVETADELTHVIQQQAGQASVGVGVDFGALLRAGAPALPVHVA
jgi:hypothetical protein